MKGTTPTPILVLPTIPDAPRLGNTLASWVPAWPVLGAAEA